MGYWAATTEQLLLQLKPRKSFVIEEQVLDIHTLRNTTTAATIITITTPGQAGLGDGLIALGALWHTIECTTNAGPLHGSACFVLLGRVSLRRAVGRATNRFGDLGMEVVGGASTAAAAANGRQQEHMTWSMRASH